MTIEHRWGPYDTLVEYLTAQLNSVADGVNKLGAAINFAASGTDRKQLMDIEFTLASIDLSSQDNPAIYLWLLRRTDGVNYEDGGDAVTPARRPDAIIPLQDISGPQRVAGLLITNPDQGKILVGNRTGVALAATGNTLKYNIYGDELETV